MAMTKHPRSDPANFLRISEDVVLGKNVMMHGFVNLYGCEIGDDTRIGAFVEIGVRAKVGARCKISSHAFICEGVTIEDEVFIGHGVMFINDRDPRATTADGQPQSAADWEVVATRVARGASIGSGAVIMCGIEIGEGALVGAGAVVTRDVSPNSVVVGTPARLLRMRSDLPPGLAERVLNGTANSSGNGRNGGHDGHSNGRPNANERRTRRGDSQPANPDGTDWRPREESLEDIDS